MIEENTMKHLAKPFFRNIPVIKRIYPSLLKKWAALTWTGGHTIKRYNGSLFMLSYRNSVDRHIAFFGFEQAQVEFLMSRMSKGCDCFIDVGANIGLYALEAARSGFAQDIHAFEPDTRNYGQFMGNLYLNDMDRRIHLHPLAVSDISGDLNFHLFPDTSTGRTRVARPGEAAVALTATTLDDFFNLTGKDIFLKIDVEGHELSVLKGGGRLLRENKCFLQVEIWPENAAQVTAFLKMQGYAQVNRIEDDWYFMGGDKSPLP